MDDCGHVTAPRETFCLGNLTASETMTALSTTYDKCVHLAPNAFQVPRGNVGRRFITTLSSYFNCFGDAGSYADSALMVAAVFQMLMLQVPRSDPPAHAKLLDRRLDQWFHGQINELLLETETIHNLRAKSSTRGRGRPDDPAREFADCVASGRLSAALRCLGADHGGAVHSISDEFDGVPVIDKLKQKHPEAEPMCDETLIPGQPPPPPHPIYFASLGRSAIRQAALGTQGAAGPSGVDAEAWRHMCSSFTDASDGLCDALASCARRVATEHIDAGALMAFTACRLLPLDKQPGVRPIGIGEVVRRIVGKAIVSIVGPAVQQVVGCSQLCAGQDCGVEAGIHAMQEAFAREETDGVLMADATNAFNRLNRSVCLRNVRHLCPPLATVLINTYSAPACLYVDGDCNLSEEGTTQGDPLAMYMYATIRKILKNCPKKRK